MTECKLAEIIGKKVKFVYEDGISHTQDKIGLVLDIGYGVIYYHNLVRDKLEIIPLTRIYRIEVLDGGGRE